MVKKKMIGVDRIREEIREKRMKRIDCVRMSVEEDNGRERGEEKQEKNGNRKESGNKEKNRRRESNPIVVCRRERKKRKGEWR